MELSPSLFAPEQLSAEQEERASIAKTLKDALIKRKSPDTVEYYYSKTIINIRQLLVLSVKGSSFHAAHDSAASLLRRVTRSPQFTTLLSAQEFPQDSWTQINENGQVFQAWTVEQSIGTFIEQADITVELSAIEELKSDIDLLVKTAATTRRTISSSEKTSLLDWLNFHQLDIPGSISSVENLVAFLEFHFPAPTRHGNYWGISNHTDSNALCIEENQYQIIKKETEKLLDKDNAPAARLINYLTDALLVTRNETYLKEYPGSSWSLLIETAEAKSFADTCYTALGWQIPTDETALSVEQRSQMLVAAVMLDVELGSVESNRRFVEEKLYNSAFVQLDANTIRYELNREMFNHRGVNEAAAPLLTELILAGIAPEFLVVTPGNVHIGSTEWVMLRKAILVSESTVPGLSRHMSYEHLLRLAGISPVSSQQQTLQDWAAVKCIVDWAHINQLMPVDDKRPQADIVQQALSDYNAYIDTASEALAAVNAKPVSRRRLAELELDDLNIPAKTLLFRRLDHKQLYVSDSIIDVYMTPPLLRQRNYDKKNGTSIYEKYPGLLTLEPINDIYQTAVEKQFSEYKAGLSTVVRIALSRMYRRQRLALEFGKVAIYHVRRFLPHAGLGSNYRPRDAADTAAFGVIILARFEQELYCFEVFPLQAMVRENPQLADAYLQGATLGNSNWFSIYKNTDEDFKEETWLPHANIHRPSYFDNEQKIREGELDTGVVIDRFVELDDRMDSIDYYYPAPLRSFNSQRFKEIGDTIAEHNPPTTYKQFYAKGFDTTERQRNSDEFRHIIDTALNIIVPFKQCIEGLASGEADRYSETVSSCIVDLTTTLLMVGGASGAVAKALTSGSKLLNLSKVSSRLLISAFNPLDGVPQLLQGGARLAGKGILKLTAHGQAFARIGASQLRALSGGSGSYDLLKALAKSGNGAEIRQSLDTVAYARALFKDDTIESASQILTRLTDNKVPLPKDASPTELNRLFQNAVVENARTFPSYKQLEQLIGDKALKELLETYLEKSSSSYATMRASGDTYFLETVDILGELELRNLRYVQDYQLNILKRDLGSAPFDGVYPEVRYNPNGYTDQAERAGAWIAYSSNSIKNEGPNNVIATLREYASDSRALNDIDLIKELHVKLADATKDVSRVGVHPEVKYPSSIGGFALMQEHLKKLDAVHDHFSKQLLATVIGYHGFGDGNGRTGRALYALSEMRRNRFQPLSNEAFDELHGLFK
ncbi:hypothetical protein ACXR0M_08230 [Pseudomonas sp. Eth.TT006]